MLKFHFNGYFPECLHYLRLCCCVAVPKEVQKSWNEDKARRNATMTALVRCCEAQRWKNHICSKAIQKILSGLTLCGWDLNG